MSFWGREARAALLEEQESSEPPSNKKEDRRVVVSRVEVNMLSALFKVVRQECMSVTAVFDRSPFPDAAKRTFSRTTTGRDHVSDQKGIHLRAAPSLYCSTRAADRPPWPYRVGCA